ncbi:ornithine aminomutase subunit alpha [Inediibacterium massiliense]|uniref:ornithine aminomutase subunit alpha n=1 Tax=Inediibacterium massiliense TaxID=1658111 RepID=UPI0006B51953|nr:ornithine aminomutase subunit alpha [Inediibacterium massiliense]
MKRADDFEKRRDHLKNLTDEELKLRFWELANQLVDPLLDLAYKNTSPSIERSILLRMGFSSMEAKVIVEGVRDRGLMGKGAGHVVYKLAKSKNMDIRDAGVALSNGEYWDEVIDLFKGGVQSETR